MTLQELIKDKMMVQGAIARRIGMTENRMSAIVRGRAELPREKMRPLADALGVSIEILDDSLTQTRGDYARDL
jgi:plasmid maintenance system antidote protein VapI